MSNTRSLPFWILVALSAVSTVAGALIAVTKTVTMETTIHAQTATGVEVYGGQAWVTLGASLAAAGLVGLFAALAVASIGSGASGAGTSERAAETQTIAEVVVPAAEPAPTRIAGEPVAEATPATPATPATDVPADRA